MSELNLSKSATAHAEEETMALWQKENTFAKSLEQRKESPRFSFYDGPPFANGLPHFGHSLVTSIKDAIGRYKTMQGYYVSRRNGWDTHGLPVEFEIEKKFNVSGKKQILEMGLEKFNQACRDSVFTYKKDWEDFFGRIGRWADTDHAYATIDRTYTESVWWVMKEIHDRNLLYRGFKSMPYCPRCETPLSNFELNEGYRDGVEDPSLFVKFQLADESACLLAWTTTPWSLPGNAALALRPEEIYVYVDLTDQDSDQKETLILAKSRLEDVLKDESAYSVTREVKGQELAGKSYKPLFKNGEDSPQLYKIWADNMVDINDGTGVLHVAPAFGEDDLNLALANDIPVLQSVDQSGRIKKGFGVDELTGEFFKDADRAIIERLTKQDAVFAAETFTHTYPFCYRCESPLLYYAVDTWFIAVSKLKSELTKTAKPIHWTPAHIKDGRFGKWLEGARDWAVSRNRYWGAAMPVWVNEQDSNDYIVIGSVKELEELAEGSPDLADLHRPFIDKVVIKKNGKTYRRVEEVIDCWFESGSMPVAQTHYPFEHKDEFEQSFPADFVTEGLDQTRLWFYVLHVISTILFDKPAYQNVLVNGMILAADGEKLSKRLKNYPPLEDVFANEGADALRLYLLSNNQAVSGDYMRFDRSAMRDLSRNVLETLGNSFRFFKMYADIDGWQPPGKLSEPSSDNVLDRWILARLNHTITESTKQADSYKLAHAIQPIFELIDDTSNWYIRRSRRRFWKSEDDQDKAQAYATLHYVLVTTCQLLAPWAPFIADRLYRELTAKSVHLSDWPEAGEVNHSLLDEMKWTREIINEGLSQRAEASIKVRQPLTKITLGGAIDRLESYEPIIRDELNVKQVINDLKSAKQRVKLDTKLTDELKAEGVARELIRHVQSLRKSSGLNVDDRIVLSIKSGDLLVNKAIKDLGKLIAQETLANDLSEDMQKHKNQVRIDGAEVELSLSKA